MIFLPPGNCRKSFFWGRKNTLYDLPFFPKKGKVDHKVVGRKTLLFMIYLGFIVGPPKKGFNFCFLGGCCWFCCCCCCVCCCFVGCFFVCCCFVFCFVVVVIVVVVCLFVCLFVLLFVVCCCFVVVVLLLFYLLLLLFCCCFVVLVDVYLFVVVCPRTPKEKKTKQQNLVF